MKAQDPIKSLYYLITNESLYRQIKTMSTTNEK